MCIGIPMQVAEPRSRYALCHANGESREVDMALVGEQPAGAWVLVFLDAAREVIGAEDAARIGDALKALVLVAEGDTNVDHLFADLIGREPELPEHLRPLARTAGGAPYTGISPHPVPPPMGEGTVRCAPGTIQASLSPLGEGQDEGLNPGSFRNPADPGHPIP